MGQSSRQRRKYDTMFRNNLRISIKQNTKYSKGEQLSPFAFAIVGYSPVKKCPYGQKTFCFKTFSVVEATGLEPTTFWSLMHNRKFFIDFPSISKSFVSATDAIPCSCSHCFHVVQIRKWSNMWSFRFHVKNSYKKPKTTYPCTYSFVCR